MINLRRDGGNLSGGCLSFKRRTASRKYTHDNTKTLTFHKNLYDPIIYFMTNLVSYRLFDLAHCKLNCGLLQVITEKENKKLSCGFSMPGVQGVTGESSLCFDTDEVIIHVTASVCTLIFFRNLMQTFENVLFLIPFWKFYFTSRWVTKLESIYIRPFNLRKVHNLN